MKYILLLLPAIALIGQEAQHKASSPELTAALDSSTKSVIVIDSKARSTDFASAFDFLRKDKPSQKIMVKTTSTTLNNVTDLTATVGGTLLIIKMLSNQGARVHVLPVEQIVEITYSP